MTRRRYSSSFLLVTGLSCVLAACSGGSDSPTAPSSQNGPDVPGHNPSQSPLNGSAESNGVKVALTTAVPGVNQALTAGKSTYVLADVDTSSTVRVYLRALGARNPNAQMGAPADPMGDVFKTSFLAGTMTHVDMKDGVDASNGQPVKGDLGVRFGSQASASENVPYVCVGFWVRPSGAPSPGYNERPDGQFTTAVGWH